MTNPELLEICHRAGIDTTENPPSPQELRELKRLIVQARREPFSLAAEVLRAQRQTAAAQRSCAAAKEASEQLTTMLKNLVQGSCEFWHLLSVRTTAKGPAAVCQAGVRVQEFRIHPDVEISDLEDLQPWEYVAVHENVAVGVWKDDPALFVNAHGEVATFNNYLEGNPSLAEVSRDGREDCIVTLSKSLQDEELTRQSKLVLQRGNPYQAIALASADQVRSKFETPLTDIDIRLEDLAGVEEIAQRLIEDVLLRIYHTDIRDQFGLQAMRGVLLYSYKPGMGKSKFVSAIARWFFDHSDVLGFDVVLYEVKPNAMKIVWHGGDAQLMREELWGKIHDRAAQPRSRPLLQFVVFDELDSLGRRGGPGDPVTSSAQCDALESLLVEMDGLARRDQDGPASHVLCFGMTNRPERVDDAAKRPGRFGDLVLAMPEVTIDGAENVMAIYTRGAGLPWYFSGEVHNGVEEDVIRAKILRPALASVFGAVILRYKTDTQRSVDVTAGEIMANVHFMDAMNSAKKRGAVRRWRNSGVPAVAYDDVVDCLIDSALSVAGQMEADPQMLIRHLQVKVPVTRVDAVAKQELAEHRYLSVHAV